MLKTIKVVTAQEMARIEALACAEGSCALHFMENAACSIAEYLIDFIAHHHLEKKITLLAGKGNNGADAFAIGALLADRGFCVTAYHIYPPTISSSLCKSMRERFEKKGGKIHEENSFNFDPKGIILDGLVGIGFKGKAEGILALAIEKANRSKLPIFSIDVPSGLDATTGAVGSLAIHATHTLYLELPKIGFFIDKGWGHIGKLQRVSFGLDEKYKEQAHPLAHLFDTEQLTHLLPQIEATRHKYQAGYVLGCAGSKDMPGAAILSSFSCLRTGAGIVRLFHPQNMQAQLSNAPYEIIKEAWNGKNTKRICEEALRAKALFIGPGMGRNKTVEQMIKRLLKTTSLPRVIDADALYFLAQNPQWHLPKETILTPHQGEMQMLSSSSNAHSIQEYVDYHQVTLVLKAAPTRIYHPNTLSLIIARGDPGMATAGSGDVLTGMIAALVAQQLPPRTAACVATTLHAIAGEIAAEQLTSYCMTASDIMHCIPMAFARYVYPQRSKQII